MQIIKQNQLDEVLQSYLASNPTKPLLVWFEDNPTIDKYLKKYISKKGVGRTGGKLLKGLLPVPYKNRSSVNVWTAGKSLMPKLLQFKQLFQLM